MREVKNNKAKGNTKITILIIILGAILIGAAAFGGYVLASKASSNASAEKEGNKQEIKEDVHQAGEF